MKRIVVFWALTAALSGARAADRDAQIRQLELLQPEAVSLALEDMAARWPQRCGAQDAAPPCCRA